MAKSIDTTLNEFRTVLAEQGSDLANFPDYGNLYIIFRSIASVISQQDTEIDILKNSLFLNTTSDANLDKRAAEYNLQRNQGTKATGTVLIESNSEFRSKGSKAFPKDTILLNPITNKQYKTTERVIINSGRVAVAVESIDTSIDSNIEAGTALTNTYYKNLNFIVGDFYNNLDAVYEGDIYGGSNKESDYSLRNRILNLSKLRQPSSLASLEITAKNVEGVNTVIVEENVPSLGYINVYIDNNNYNIIKKVESTLEKLKPLGTILTVKQFSRIPLNINVNVEISNRFDLSNKDNLIRGAIVNFINGLNNEFTKESLAATILNIPSISNVKIIAPIENLTIKSKERFTVGSINIQII